MAYKITQEQNDKIDEISLLGYKVNLYDGISAGGLCMDKGIDRWFFGLDGSITHIPDKTK